MPGGPRSYPPGHSTRPVAARPHDADRTCCHPPAGHCPSTLQRWLNDGFVAGEQVTPGAPSDQPHRSATACSPTPPLTAGSPSATPARPRRLPPDRIKKVKRAELNAVLIPHRSQERRAHRDPRPASRPVPVWPGSARVVQSRDRAGWRRASGGPCPCQSGQRHADPDGRGSHPRAGRATC